MATMKQFIPTNSAVNRQILRNAKVEIHVAFPAIVSSVNSNGTVNVQPAIRERMVGTDGLLSYVAPPIIPNVPVCMPSSGGCYISMPISVGDECLVVITDQSFDYWWLYGGIQNPVEQRRHDLTDAFAIFGIRSQPRNIGIPSTLKIMNGSSGIEITESGVIIHGTLTEAE